LHFGRKTALQKDIGFSISNNGNYKLIFGSVALAFYYTRTLNIHSNAPISMSHVSAIYADESLLLPTFYLYIHHTEFYEPRHTHTYKYICIQYILYCNLYKVYNLITKQHVKAYKIY